MSRSFEMIDTVRLDSIVDTVKRMDAFAFRPDRGWVWLQRLCFRFLRWRGCQFMDKTYSIKRHVIHPDKVRDAVWAQLESMDVIGHRIGAGGEVVLIGRDDFMRMLDQSDAPDTAFFVNLEYMNNRTILGMRAVVVPWMRGVVVLPAKIVREMTK